MAGPDPAPADLADEVARAALACDCVAELSGDLATFLAGRRVPGVRLDEQVCEVAVVLRLDGRPLPELAEEVRAAVQPVVGDLRVDVLVADVQEAEDDQQQEPSPEPSAP